VKQAELTSCTVTFPEGSRDLTLVCSVASHEVSFFIHLPEQYPFHPPRVACQPSAALESLSALHQEEDIVAVVLGESWIPAINLLTLLGRLQHYAQHQFKPKTCTTLFPHGTWLLLLLAIGVRLGTALGPYSGYEKPPMYGDYEAQRHWMELTLNLPTTDWYRNTTLNDLNYWGLDYPPLTAYHSYLMGQASAAWEPSSMILLRSRGYETPSHKGFMRFTVLCADLMTLIPAVVLFYKSYYRYVHRGVQAGLIALTLTTPAFILIDYGHFQYNCVVLGLTLFSALSAISGNLLLSAFCFTLALNYKITALYYALPVFVVLLKRAVQQASVYSSRYRSTVRIRQKRVAAMVSELSALLFSLAAITVTVTIVLWLPWMTQGGWEQVIARLFPFERGLFEDKVANFWCISSIVIKWKEVLGQGLLTLLCAVTTLLGTVPSLLCLWRKNPTSLHFLLALGNSAMSFFLFSYHVHEKGILLPLFPYLIITALEEPGLFPLLSALSTFSLYPLLVKDGLRLVYFLLVPLHFGLSSYLTKGIQTFQKADKPLETVTRAFLGGAGLIHLLELLEPPAQLPYLFATLVSAYAFIGFLCIWLYLNWKQWSIPESDDLRTYVEPSFRHKPKFA
jgi:alpha-1,3-glucosyltransferase